MAVSTSAGCAGVTSRLERLRLATTISEGKLTANATDAHLYGGLGKGVLGIEPKGDGAAVSLERDDRWRCNANNAEGFMDFDWLDGRGRLALGLSGEGASEKQIVDGLQGRAEIKVADGALVGWDLTQMLRGLRQGTLPSTDRHPSARTGFGDLTGSFVIADGVARNEDLKVTGRAISAVRRRRRSPIATAPSTTRCARDCLKLRRAGGYRDSHAHPWRMGQAGAVAQSRQAC